MATQIIEAQNEVKQLAYEAKKHRWSSKLAMLPDPRVVILNPSLEQLDA